MPTLLIVNADDFGASHAVNAAVLQAHRNGVLTSASLMVTGNAAGEAVRVARENLRLAVGLHLVLGDANPVSAGLRYAFHGPSRRRLRAELEDQFDAFADTGLSLSHVDGHQHMHAHPAVLPTVIELAVKHGATGIRVPREPIWLSLRLDRFSPAFKAGAAAGTAFLCAVCKLCLRDCGLARCDYSIGTLMSGMMNSGFAVRVLRELKCRSVELFTHPCVGHERVPFGPNRGDLDALLSAQFKRFVSSPDWRLTTYSGLAVRSEEVNCERV